MILACRCTTWAQVTHVLKRGHEARRVGRGGSGGGKGGKGCFVLGKRDSTTYQERAILIPAIVHSEPRQLRVHVEVQERAVRRGRDVRVQVPVIVRHGAVLTVVRVPADVGRARDVEDVDVSVDRERLVLAAPEAAVAGEDEELAVGQRVELGLRGDFGVLGVLGGVVVVERERDDVLGDVDGRELVRDVVRDEAGVLFCLGGRALVGGGQRGAQSYALRNFRMGVTCRWPWRQSIS